MLDRIHQCLSRGEALDLEGPEARAALVDGGVRRQLVLHLIRQFELSEALDPDEPALMGLWDSEGAVRSFLASLGELLERGRVAIRLPRSLEGVGFQREEVGRARSCGVAIVTLVDWTGGSATVQVEGAVEGAPRFVLGRDSEGQRIQERGSSTEEGPVWRRRVRWAGALERVEVLVAMGVSVRWIELARDGGSGDSAPD